VIQLTFRSVPLEEHPAASLVDAMRAEIAEVYDELDLDGEAMPRAGPRELGPPGGTFLVGFDQEGRPLCGELLGALEDAARELSYRIVRLDTGPRQPSAERMYRDAGYRPIENFNQNPIASFFGEKPLGQSSPSQ
jgi:hypothetical protein